MNAYSLTLLIKDKVDEKGRTGIFDDVKKNFSNVIKEDLWGVRSLAYEIQHESKAFYAYFEFEAEPNAVITLDKNIRLNEDIMRSLLVKAKKIKIRPGKAKKEPKTEVVEASAKAKESEEAPAKETKDEVKEEKKAVKKVIIKKITKGADTKDKE